MKQGAEFGEGFEIPEISRRWLPARRFIDCGMRAGIPDRRTRRSTLTVYADIGVLLEAFDIDSTTSIAVFVVAQDGIVQWRGRGPFRPQHTDQLERAIATVGAGGSKEPEFSPGSGPEPGYSGRSLEWPAT